MYERKTASFEIRSRDNIYYAFRPDKKGYMTKNNLYILLSKLYKNNENIIYKQDSNTLYMVNICLRDSEFLFRYNSNKKPQYLKDLHPEMFI